MFCTGGSAKNPESLPTDCGQGLATPNPGAKSRSQCFTEAGWGRRQVRVNGSMTFVSVMCPLGTYNGWYKEGWNRNLCVRCGNYLSTQGNGSTSKDDCLVPIGANLYTLDVLTKTNATDGYTSEEACLLKPGWGIGPTGLIDKCPPGLFNPGYNRAECSSCPSGYMGYDIVLDDGEINGTVCVVQAGWAVDPRFGVPVPCDKGTYSPGGTDDDINGACIACPQGYTTQNGEAEALTDCECTVSRRGNTDPGNCFTKLLSPIKDYAPLNDDSFWSRQASLGSTTQQDCQAACDGNPACMMTRFGTAAPGADAQQCDLLLEAPAGQKAVAFKAGGDLGLDFAVYTIPAGLVIGVQVLDLSASNFTASQCMGACRANRAQCELATFDAAQLQDVNATGSCALFRSDYDAEWASMFHVQGEKLFGDLAA
eukprot:gene14240-14388_t